jgi:hypothetical protein
VAAKDRQDSSYRRLILSHRLSPCALRSRALRRHGCILSVPLEQTQRAPRQRGTRITQTRLGSAPHNHVTIVVEPLGGACAPRTPPSPAAARPRALAASCRRTHRSSCSPPIAYPDRTVTVGVSAAGPRPPAWGPSPAARAATRIGCRYPRRGAPRRLLASLPLGANCSTSAGSAGGRIGH